MSEIKIFNCDCFELIGSQNFIDFVSERKVILVTDPPFNVGYHYNEYKDNMDEEEYYLMLKDLYESYEFLGEYLYITQKHCTSYRFN